MSNTRLNSSLSTDEFYALVAERDAALAWFITAKFIDSLPLYRIAVLLKRFGGDISRNTLAASVVRIGIAVQPIINLLRDHILDSDIVFGDETVVQVLKESGRAAQTKSYMWIQMNDGCDPPVRLFGKTVVFVGQSLQAA